ncbi:type I restriction endonuclease subunit R [Sphaerotilus microaerophilus]|uniref:Type I restriction enzyme endonuclease subunit n=1 Tax=Sphaerotilus microaerophilus TaxID=2914710 RepID=A0ABN6PLY5_9BURK|nr:type I restriction endonuclease subunit R [Sphaerotilus sp. FB-5]BDI06164.1 restriction endonuclease [Sphaerotilus sp. FB-5]
MTAPPRPERVTQNRVIERLTGPADQGGLGYAYLGDWSERPGNRCVEAGLLRANLLQRGYTDAHVSQALQRLMSASDATGITLYQANLRSYQLLRYGVPVQLAPGAPHETVHLIDWTEPGRNHFALAEEVTLQGAHERRPDLVVYLNGLAVVVIELKRSSVDVGNGIRQLITNQEPAFHQAFFSTVQLVMAGSDSQGLRYGTTGTPEKFFVAWKHQADPAAGLAPGELLDGPLAQMLQPERLLDLLRHFIIFDGGQKKVPRLHQYEGIKAAQARIARQEGGVIWHTQGSGKSILMVLLAKWLLEHDPEARVLVITDRDELDKQIEGVMRNAGVIGATDPSPRILSRRELVDKLGAGSPRLMCALIHKVDVSDLRGEPPRLSGRFYVFVDECHRTQGGDMNRQMKRWLAGALFIGFTGTPLLRRDRQTTREVFGSFIHTYKFHEAVEDEVVLDLKYEAREVPQALTSPKAVDDWFETRTRSLNRYQKSVLRSRWATMEELMSSAGRKQRIVADINHDFGVLPRLNNGRGTAFLVAASIYDACHYHRLFQGTPLGPACGLITSFEPNAGAITQEPQDSDERYKFDTYTELLSKSGFKTTAQYETEMKRRFIEEPANLKLLIVVSKLLTGFDAPSCTCIYLDNELRDHNLFQAICRTNRLDGDDKTYGHIVDYKALLANVQNAIAVYTSDEIDTESCGADGNVEVKDWREAGRTRLDEAREALHYLCEPVAPPRGIEQFILYFCGDGADAAALATTEPLRIAFYKAVAAFLRAYAELAPHLEEAGYPPAQVDALAQDARFHADLRAAIKNHAGEELDVKPYEADMRHLINTYILAQPTDVLGDLEGVSLTEWIVKSGVHDAIAAKLNARGQLSRKTIAESILNNVRKTIVHEQLTNPKYYEQMSRLLDDLIRKQRDDAQSYEAFLRSAEELARKVVEGAGTADLPAALKHNKPAAVLYQNLPGILAAAAPPNTAAESAPPYPGEFVALALQLDRAVCDHAPADWRGDPAREAQLLNVLFPLMKRNRPATMAIFEIIKNQPGY